MMASVSHDHDVMLCELFLACGPLDVRSLNPQPYLTVIKPRVSNFTIVIIKMSVFHG